MIYLFVHQNFPGQYKNIVQHLVADPANTVYFVSKPNENWITGVIKLVYAVEEQHRPGCHPYAIDFDGAVRHGAAVAKSLEALKKQGVRPDVILGHSGWGEMLFVKDVYPDVPVVSYFEFFYLYQGADSNFDPEFGNSAVDPMLLRARNAINALSWLSCDVGNTPTQWQLRLHPPEMRERIKVLHEGVDTKRVAPDPNASVALGPGRPTFRPGDEVVTYVSRNLEPYRGFHVFMRALPELLARRPNAHVLVVGGDDVSYGAKLGNGMTYRQLMLNELGPRRELERVHFLGQVPYETYLSVLQVSAVHVYLTYPFVLSWSFVEAMAAGCAIVASNTPPVAEYAEHGKHARLVDFFSTEQIVDTVAELLADRKAARDLRRNARRRVVESLDLHGVILPAWRAFLDEAATSKRDPAA